MLQRALEDPVGEPRIARQQWAVEIRSDRSASTDALEPALPVVPEPGDDTSERLSALVELRDAGVVLEAGQRPTHAGLELTLQQTVTDHPPVARNGLERKETRARQLPAVPAAIRPAKELIAAADRQHRHPAGNRLPDRRAPRSEIRCDQGLLAILAAPDVEQVVLARPQLVAEAERLDVEPEPPPARTAREHRDVAAVGVDVQVLRVEVRDPNRHAARSQ